MSGLRGNFIRQSVLYGVESGPALLAKLDFFGIRYPIYQLILVEIDNYNELRALDSNMTAS